MHWVLQLQNRAFREFLGKKSHWKLLPWFMMLQGLLWVIPPHHGLDTEQTQLWQTHWDLEEFGRENKSIHSLKSDLLWKPMLRQYHNQILALGFLSLPSKNQSENSAWLEMDKSHLHAPPASLAGTLKHFTCLKVIKTVQRHWETPPKALFSQHCWVKGKGIGLGVTLMLPCQALRLHSTTAALLSLHCPRSCPKSGASPKLWLDIENLLTRACSKQYHPHYCNSWTQLLRHYLISPKILNVLWRLDLQKLLGQ